MADSFHIIHIASTGGGNKKLCFLFQSDKNSGCYGNLKFPQTYNGKKWKLTISAESLGIFDFVLQKCLLSSPPRFIRLWSKLLNLIG